VLDLRITGGNVVDGTGRQRFRADVGVAGGRIVEIGRVDGEARQAVDATGLVVAPGFVDTHTHHDAGVFWDGTASPSPLHGVTTVIGGNCGFTIAPLASDARDYVMRMLARVEGMPLEALEEGVPWDWASFGEFLDRLDGTLGVNAGFLVGHSTVRRLVLGDDAVRRAATPDEVAAMVAVLRRSLDEGALGFSSSLGTTHNDGDGNPVPSRAAGRDELLALAGAVAGHDGTCLAINAGPTPFDESAMALLAALSREGRRVLNWNALLVDVDRWDTVQNELALSDYAAARGGQVVAQVVVDPRRFYLSFLNGFIVDALPGWAPLFALPLDERARRLADPETRRALRAGADDPSVPAMVRRYTDWARLVLVDSPSGGPELVGRTVGEVAAGAGADPLDALLDLAVADGLRTVFMPTPLGDDDESWRRRAEVWRDPRTVLGASDAGAHLDVASSFTWTSSLLGGAVRGRGLLTLEEAVHQLTDVQRGVCGLRDRGRVATGWAADLVVLDPATVDTGPVHVREDLPGGARRLFADATGIAHVFVNGTEVVREGELLDARPGTVLRSGRDTDTPGV
jgi:N-acyl-D-aspartate/D-glutamate deacylase